MQTNIDEIAPDLFRISAYIPKADLQFNQFLVRDDEPLLFHTGLRGMFPRVRDAVATIINPSDIRWISFSHFEGDECGSLNEWLKLAPRAKPFCGIIGSMINIDDFSDRRSHVLPEGEVLSTGRYRFRFLETPHVPHGWDAGLLLEEKERTLFCSDLFMQQGDIEAAVVSDDILPQTRSTILNYEGGPLAHGLPFTPHTLPTLRRLAELQPRLLAVMHGSSYLGDGREALHGLADLHREVLGNGREWEVGGQ